ncbi:hypothetical protein [Nocardioides alcanivorans]|uniref:hypothetical protein n=1 Tax=Nocardioides alcanivorans TaxID=2897352 RepID=UPI001F2D55EC|nr:hypothetical protein [Nocardioides alcanivorans]
MEILWWLAPSVVVTVLAMVWVGWLGRDGRGEVDRDVAAERMAKALRAEHQGLRQASPRLNRRPDRSSGVAARAPRANASGEERRTA